tara:strand:+ start:250 stop:699 length:450 start_codon:yes stop_codon:yes gene_type:complete
MKEDKVKWCLKQTKGIKLIDLKPHLSESYMDRAEDTLETALLIKGEWKLITSYYACYNAFYSLLMKTGIKCEIHDCTLELMKLFDFDDSDIIFLKNLKKDRIDTQYYLKKITFNKEADVKKFIFKCKLTLGNLNSHKIEEIRNKIKVIK